MITKKTAKALLITVIVVGAVIYVVLEFMAPKTAPVEVVPTEQVVDTSAVDSSFVDTSKAISK